MHDDEIIQYETFRDRISTVDTKGKRNWIFALQPSGRFYTLRKYSSYIYLGLFFLLPFINFQGQPIFLLNVLESRFILFGKIFWPQDFFILAVGMVAFMVFIVLFTLIYGRLFCGWACPQTIFMEFVFRRIEWWIEGSPSQQRALQDGKWTTNKIWRKTVKHIVFILFSFLIAHTALAYIIGVREIWNMMKEPFSQNMGMLAGLTFFTLLFYSVFAFVREIVCTTICPYGRLQGVLFDKDTMQISYDHKRGEPRHKLKKSEVRTQGDCIDCKKCVIVCPTGIDIRDGVQMDCVGCTACIDACDDVMDKVGFPRGLIRYASENQIVKGTKFHFTSKMKAYSGVLILLLSLMSVLLITRSPLDTIISRVKGQLYQETETTYSNLFEAKIFNKYNREVPIELRLENFDGEFRLIGNDAIIAKPSSVSDFHFFLDIPKEAIKERSTLITIGVYQDGERIERIKTKFLGPFK